MRLREINVQSGAETELDASSEIMTQPLTVKEMLSQLKLARDAAIARGIEVNGLRVQTDDLSQQRLTAAAIAAQLDPSVIVRWKTADGSFVSLSASQIVAVALAVRNHVQSCFDREAALVAQIMASEDPSSVPFEDF